MRVKRSITNSYLVNLILRRKFHCLPYSLSPASNSKIDWTLQNSYLNISFKDEKILLTEVTILLTFSWTIKRMNRTSEWLLLVICVGKNCWLPLLLLYSGNNSFTTSLISHLQPIYVSLMWDDCLVQLYNLSHEFDFARWISLFSLLSRLYSSNSIVELSITFLEIVFD